MKNEKDEQNSEDVEFVESDEEGNPVTKKDIEKKLRSELKDVKKERDDYLTGWQRAKADYVNLQKELNDVKINTSILSKEKVINTILPVLDSFDMAMSNTEAWNKVDQNWRQGIEYIYQQFIRSLSDLDVVKINEVNIDFNPSIHQPINTVNTEDHNLDDKVAKVIQAGYKIGERVVRPARVEVYKSEQS